jgi:hypothetical protein
MPFCRLQVDMSTNSTASGLFKNTMEIVTLFALSNLWMVKRSLMSQQLRVRE